MNEIEPHDKRSEFLNSFKDLFENDIVPVDWSVEKKARVDELTSDNRLNTARFATIPMLCRGSACPSAKVCPLYAESLHPLGSPCPIEMKLVGKMVLGLIEEMDIDPESINEVGMVRDLIDQEIQQLRKQSMLAQDDIIQDNVIGIDEQGDPIIKKELHLGVDWEDRIHKRKAALLKQLLATRESRVKAGAMVMDQATNMALALGKFQKVQAEKDAELRRSLGLGDVDEYIESQIREKEQKELDSGQ